jgi:hypothetical protein
MAFHIVGIERFGTKRASFQIRALANFLMLGEILALEHPVAVVALDAFPSGRSGRGCVIRVSGLNVPIQLVLLAEFPRAFSALVFQRRVRAVLGQIDRFFQPLVKFVGVHAQIFAAVENLAAEFAHESVARQFLSVQTIRVDDQFFEIVRHVRAEFARVSPHPSRLVTSVSRMLEEVTGQRLLTIEQYPTIRTSDPGFAFRNFRPGYVQCRFVFFFFRFWGWGRRRRRRWWNDCFDFHLLFNRQFVLFVKFLDMLFQSVRIVKPSGTAMALEILFRRFNNRWW